MIVGHPKVTKDAYEHSTQEQRSQAVRFAEATVSNGLGADRKLLPDAVVKRLIVQIERDYLVAIVCLT